MEGDRICGIGGSLRGNDIVDVCEPGGGQGVGADLVGNERDVRGGELAVVEGPVESHDGHSAVGRDGVPVTVGVTVDGKFRIAVHGFNLSVVGVDVGVGGSIGIVLIGEVGTGKSGTVVGFGSPGEGQSAVRNSLSGVVSMT